MQSQLYGFDIIQSWQRPWILEEIAHLGEANLDKVSDPRFGGFKERIDVKGLTVLELGPFEARNTFLLHSWGAKKVIAVEGRTENFLKCLIIKNALTLDGCEFLCGDVNATLDVLTCHFDVCVAVGILYHVRDPVSLLYRIARLCDRLFVWTHFADATYPHGPDAALRRGLRVYRGKYFYEDTSSGVGSLEEKVFWLFEDDLLEAIRDAGFKRTEVIHKERHEHGPLLSLWAQK
jgi:SAM-dependent methyltransferase